MISSFVLLALGATCWYSNIKVLEQYFTVERVLDTRLHLQEMALLATLPIALVLIHFEPFYSLLILIYIVFCRRAVVQLLRLIIRALRMPVHFVDVLFGDFMTSYAKVFADMVPIPALKPWVTCFPYFIRAKQCLIEYLVNKKQMQILNFFKYCSSFPVIITGYIITSSGVNFTENPMVVTWFAFVIFNSAFTFVWDVKCDWGLWEREYKFLRAQLLFPKYVYWLAVVIDFNIRFFWLINSLFTHWNLWDSNVSFSLECLELFRRWVWVFLRVEKELVYRSSYLNPLSKRKSIESD